MSELRRATRLTKAIDDFRRARLRAVRERLWARLTGESADLLSYEDVRRKLRATQSVPRGLQDISLDAIVGTVGRCADFTRSFLPRLNSSEQRWAGVEAAMIGDTGLPPIEVYQIDQVYFVRDGNHRVSAARQLGATHIQAYVKEVRTKVSLSPDVQPDDLIIKAEQVEFLQRTALDQLRPEANVRVSVPGQYPKLEEHISVHRYFMGIDQKREVAYHEAVEHWYDTVYLPVVEVARAQKLLVDFPDRTESDLYLWIMEHRVSLEQELDWEVRTETAASDIVTQHSPRATRVLARLSDRLLDAIVPEGVRSGPAPGKWREDQLAQQQDGRIFTDILVPVGPKDGGWAAMEQALEILRRQDGRLLGIHIVPSESEREGEAARAIEAEFDRRCEVGGVRGTLSVEVGDVASRICEKAHWTGLVAVSVAHPPADEPIARLSSGFRTLVQRCPSPVLAVPVPPPGQGPSSLGSALLAYDGSRKANEALYLSAYLAGQWHIPLVVVTVMEDDSTSSKTLARAEAYLDEHDVQATYITEKGSAGEAILSSAVELESELIVMGGYGFGPFLQIVLGSAVDHVLRHTRQPVLICR